MTFTTHIFDPDRDIDVEVTVEHDMSLVECATCAETGRVYTRKELDAMGVLDSLEDKACDNWRRPMLVHRQVIESD